MSRSELQLLDEFIKAGANAYVSRKQRKTLYMLQKLRLVATYTGDGDWQMLMPDKVRKSLSEFLPDFMKIVEQGMPTPSYKKLRMMEAMNYTFGKQEIVFRE